MALPTKSIRWRFALWLALLLVFVLTGFGLTAYQLHRNVQFNRLDEELKYRVSALSAALRLQPPPLLEGQNGNRGPGVSDGPLPFDRDPSGQRLPKGPPSGFDPGRAGPRGFRFGPREIQLSTEALGLFDTNMPSGFYYVLWPGFGGAKPIRSTNAPTAIPQPEQAGHDTGTYTRTRDNFREAYHYTELGDCVLAGRSVAKDVAATRRFAALLIAGGVAVLLLSIAGIWVLTGRALKPVEEISAAATRISAGHLSERINVSDTDNELGQLAGTLNSTFARLEAAFAQQRQFTADASHELRTPLAVLISEAQTTLAHQRTAGEYRETVAACLETAQQMRRLTESLLELARLDAGQQQIQPAPFDLAETARACVELIQPLADQRAIRIHCDLTPTQLTGDAARLSQVITNLLANAIQYNKPPGEIKITTRPENDMAVLTVADTGQGIAPEDLPHIFERFYRADKSRTHTSDHTGLGLAICQSIVEAHGGRITVQSTPGNGAEFTVTLPPSPLWKGRGTG
jgi:two-component system, OmpR family, sensor kinase